MALSTVIGVAAIAPFFAVLGDPALIRHERILKWLFVHFRFTSERDFVIGLGAAFITVVLVANLINVLGSLSMRRVALRIGNELQTTLFEEYLVRPYAFHADTSSTRLFNNIMYEIGRVTNGILQNLFTVVTNGITTLFIVVSIILLNPTLAFAIISGLVGGYFLIYLVVRAPLMRSGQAQSRHAVDQARVVNETFAAIREVTILQVQAFFRDRFKRSSLAFALATAHNQVVAQTPKHVMESVAVIGLVVTALVLGYRNEGAGPWLGELTFLAFAVYRLLPTLQQMFAAIVRIRSDQSALALVSADLRQARASARARAAAKPANSDFGSLDLPQREVRLKGVSFRYASDRSWALRQVSLCIPARSIVGIVGANGSGKTTLVDVLAGLLVPATGEIEIDGVRLIDSNRAAWQSRISYVPQNIFLLDSSVAENIALGVSSEDIDQSRLRMAAHFSQLDELVEQLPNGYGHRVGERGVELSGGQRQRIGIARALYRRATVLLLDEATSALDGLSEQELMATLRRLQDRYTTVLVAHRMSTVRECDLIIEMENGRIVATGTYDELLQTSSQFRKRVHGT